MKRLLSIALLAGAGYCLWRQLKVSPAARVPAAPSDELLTRRVQVALRQAGGLPEHLHLRVVDGTAMLSGSVTPAERDRVLRAALSAPGIRGVRNGLAVESGPWEPSPSAP
ncbi:MAG TPA: BON domain-containing protein [Burkholderiales bacterium]|nr:BON domain-containing protein [Burkholderiales bacterium]